MDHLKSTEKSEVIEEEERTVEVTLQHTKKKEEQQHVTWPPTACLDRLILTRGEFLN